MVKGGRFVGHGGQGLGPSGFCVCSCGHREPHETSIPCFQKICPHCGKPLGRG